MLALWIKSLNSSRVFTQRNANTAQFLRNLDPLKITSPRFRVSPAVARHPDILGPQEKALVVVAFVTGQRRFSNLLRTEGVNGTRVVDRAA